MERAKGTSPSPQAWYSAPAAEFLSSSPEYVVGSLTADSDVHVRVDYREGWRAQIDLRTRAVRLATLGERRRP